MSSNTDTVKTDYSGSVQLDAAVHNLVSDAVGTAFQNLKALLEQQNFALNDSLSLIGLFNQPTTTPILQKILQLLLIVLMSLLRLTHLHPATPLPLKHPLERRAPALPRRRHGPHRLSSAVLVGLAIGRRRLLLSNA